MFSVMLVDDQSEILEYLSALVEGTGIARVVATAKNSSEALAKAESHQPDIIMLDVALGGTAAFEIVREILSVASDSRILAVSYHGSPGFVRRMLNVGARGYLLKEDAPVEVKNAIVALINGEKWFSQGLINRPQTSS